MKEMESFLQELREETLDSEMVFGEPKEFPGLAVIPVAKISYGWGAGGGKGKMPEKKNGHDGEKVAEGEGEGEGFGIGIRAKPLGYIEIKDGATAYRPIVDINKMLMIAAPVLGFTLIKAFKSLSKH